MVKKGMIFCLTILAALLLGRGFSSGFQDEGTLRIGQMNEISGPFGETGLEAFFISDFSVKQINDMGGVKVDGKMVKLDKRNYDSACNPEQGINVTRKMATEDKVLVIVGPGCSSVAEPAYGLLQKKLDDANDIGLQVTIFTDIATKFGIEKISPWAVRNTGNEKLMYDDLFAQLKKLYNVKTVAIGYEKNFTHSKGTYELAYKAAAEKYDIKIVEVQDWLTDDTDFSVQITKLKRAKADLLATAAHHPTLCRAMQEAKRQGWTPKLHLGITSAAIQQTLDICKDVVENLIIPTNFLPLPGRPAEVYNKILEASKDKWHMTHHNSSSYEVFWMIKKAIEETDIKNRPETLQQDRRKFRDALVKFRDFPGLMGPITFEERQATKVHLMGQVKGGKWVQWQPTSK
ncbi:MAG: ABC transporter substrate-binding protein [Candidatus Tectomicrobia bacterium]|uniref:ABC transporter substrate-binding protein n=1 Tax=Tectimicrobiota bacterium TaxID=2528274 RepID=A0A933GM76_UNCTE|nr:ABC transporter substrate-binding protein [Candidatus Tectomicrobia bacterium]